MTIDEITKAWEEILATGDAPIGEHWSCGGVVTTKLAKETFDMLNRQKTEIDILIRKKETLRDELEEKQTEIERLKAKVEVKRGRWMRYGDDWECSNCDVPLNGMSPYCPFCGAKMDERPGKYSLQPDDYSFEVGV